MQRRTFSIAMLVALTFPYSIQYAGAATHQGVGLLNSADRARLQKALMRAKKQAGILGRTLEKYQRLMVDRSAMERLKLLRRFHYQDIEHQDYLVLEEIWVTPAEWVYLSGLVEL